MGLSEEEKDLVAGLEGRQEPMETLLGKLVGQSSQSGDGEGLDAVASMVEAELEALGFRVAVMVTGGQGRTLVARHPAENSHRLLLLGHLDTVHPKDGDFREYAVDPEDSSRATGPGAADMKGGLVVVLEALRALKAAGRLEGRHVTVVFNPDEEVGSPSSADLIRAEAMEHDLCLCFEAGRPLDGGASTFVNARRGFGRFRLAATGRPAHAGVDGARGASAVHELAHKTVALTQLVDGRDDVTLNVGVFRGGTAANTVAEEAELLVDYRFDDEDAQLEIEDEILMCAGKAHVRDASGNLAVSTRIHDHVKRPAMVPTDAIERMTQRVIDWGRDLGLTLEPERRGGSSDAALAAEAGCPTLCGLGVVGDRFHTPDEFVLRESLTDRARLLALTADRFFRL